MKTLQQLFDTAHPVAMITGSGAPRVGNCIARTIAGRGFHIVLHCNTSREYADKTAQEIEASGGTAMVVQGAVEDEDVVKQMFQQVDKRFGRIDVLVNSAAIWGPKRLEDVTAADVRRYLEINTLGSFLTCKAAGERMVGQPTGGAIVNIGDWAVARPYVDHAAYFPSKGAIPAMTRSFALELAERNRKVRVNAILPGPVMLGDDLSETMQAANEESTLLKRVGGPEHVAHAVEFLIENDFVTGVCLPVDGGRTIYAGDPMQIEHHRLD